MLDVSARQAERQSPRDVVHSPRFSYSDIGFADTCVCQIGLVCGTRIFGKKRIVVLAAAELNPSTWTRKAMSSLGRWTRPRTAAVIRNAGCGQYRTNALDAASKLDVGANC